MPPKAHPTSVQPLGAPEQLLVNRVQTARVLGLSMPSVIRLELEGQLTADQVVAQNVRNDVLSPRTGVRSCRGEARS